MMKKWKKLIILLVIFVILLMTFIYLNGGTKKTDNESESPTDTSSSDIIKLFDIERVDISKIVLKREEGEIVLTLEERDVEALRHNEDGTITKETTKKMVWVNPYFDVDNELAEDMVYFAATVMTKRLINENPDNPEVYGLNKNIVTTFVTKEGKEASIEIGNLTPLQDSYYVRKPGSPEVYTIDSYTGETFRYGKLDLMNKNIYGTEAVTVYDINYLSFSRDGEHVFSAEKKTDEDWIITAPVPEREANITELSKFLNWVSSFRVNKFITENPTDLSSYGLDSPKYVFEYTLSDKTYRLMLGSRNGSEYYGILDGNNTVFTVDATNLDFVDLTLKDLQKPD
ncbi:MAG: DUF4340 domain-containing protein [Clostridiaceae bacterium]|nr:DUF4340 domain-containing protein [Clostridiaceae bacterium]